METAAKDADQYTFRQAGMPYLTHFVLSAERNKPDEPQVSKERRGAGRGQET